MKNKKFSENNLYWLTLLVAVCFFLLFSGHLQLVVDFWSLFSSFLLVFLVIVLWLDPLWGQLILNDLKERKGAKILIGLISAVVLYGLFYGGNLLLGKFLINKSEYLSSIYNLKIGSNSLRIGIFLALIIGPGEELLWRYFLQRRWAARIGQWPAMVLVAVLYAAVHLSTKNPVLVLAALVCGLWWGYQFLKFRSILANVISHVLWDLMVFMLFPLV
jgi:CAAX amino terminal protease family.